MAIFSKTPLSQMPIPIQVGQFGETLPTLTRLALEPIKNLSGECIIRLDIETLKSDRCIEVDLVDIVEDFIRARTVAGNKVHLEMIVHSIRAGREQAIYAALQDLPKNGNEVCEDLGAVPDDQTIAERLVERMKENYETQEQIIRWMTAYAAGEFLGTMQFRAHPVLGSYESLEAQIVKDGESVWHKAIVAPRQVGVHSLATAGLIVPMNIPFGTQISRTFIRRWMTGIIKPEPIADYEEFAKELVRQWRSYRMGISESLREKRLATILDEVVRK